MAPWKVILTDGLESIGKQILAKDAQVDDKKGISAEDLIQIIGEYDAMIVRGRTKVTRALLEAGKNLKIVGRSGVGVDNIDLEAAKEKGVLVVNAPIATTLAVAELTIGLIFSLAREIPRVDKALKNGDWIKSELMGSEVRGKTLGIIGFGRIGSAVAQMAAGMGMHIIGCTFFNFPETIRIMGGELCSFEDVLTGSDFISIHTPLTTETRGLINAHAIAKMKDGVRIVCAARGGIIDETALLDALTSGKVAGAALDVFSTEPPGDSELVRHPRVIATPHIGGQTIEAQSRAAEDICTEVLSALRGERLRWKVV